MGAANALAAYRLYAGKVPPTSLNVLAYMALVALDRNSEPCWWEGHDMIAVRCLGHPEPVSEAALRAVRRAISPLFKAGAITTDRHSSGHGSRYVTVRYRLWLVQPAQVENRPVQNRGVGRKVVSHRTKSGQPQDGNRPPKEDEEDEEREINGSVVVATVEGDAAALPNDQAENLPAAPDTHTRNGTELVRQAAADALTEWICAHPEAAT